MDNYKITKNKDGIVITQNDSTVILTYKEVACINSCLELNESFSINTPNINVWRGVTLTIKNRESYVNILSVTLPIPEQNTKLNPITEAMFEDSGVTITQLDSEVFLSTSLLYHISDAEKGVTSQFGNVRYVFSDSFALFICESGNITLTIDEIDFLKGQLFS